MKHSTRQWLLKLLKIGRLPHSSVSKSSLPEINNIKNQGFIDWEKSGRGVVYIIRDQNALKTLLDATGYHGSIKNLTSKARAVALHKDAHMGRDDTLLILLSATQDVVWRNHDLSINIYQIVRECGIASLLVKPADNWVTDAPIALVENLDLLVHATRYFKKINFQGSFLYYSGWVSKRIAAWLERQKNTPITIFPDYDLVGLTNYLLLKKNIPNLQIYIPDKLTELIKRYGKPEKLVLCIISKEDGTKFYLSTRKKFKKIKFDCFV